MVDVVNLLDLLEATEDDEDIRLAGRLRGVLPVEGTPTGFALVDHIHTADVQAGTLTPEGYPQVINVTDPHPDISAVAAVGDGSTDDNTALQNIFDWLKGARTADHVVWFPFMKSDGGSARYMTSKPLRVWTNTRIKGPATIQPTDDFDWTTHPYSAHAQYKPVGNATPGDIGLMELWNNATTRGGSSRIMLDDLRLDCRGQAGSLGFFSKMQQPAHTWKLRIDNADTGWMLWGQQSDHFIAEIINCKVGLFLGDLSGNDSYGTGSLLGAKFMSFYTLNIEGYTEAAIRMKTDGPNWFYDLHTEFGDGTNIHVVDALEGEWHLINGWATHGGSDNHVFVIGDDDPIPTSIPRTSYSIRNFRLAGNASAGQLMVDDKVRSFSRTVNLHRFIDELHAFKVNDTQQDWDANIEYLGDDGGFIRFGGVRGGTAAPAGHTGAQTTVQANVGQDEPMARWNDSGGTTRFNIEEGGAPVLPPYSDATRPAASSVPVGTKIWNTDDNADNGSDGTDWRDAAGSVT